MIVNGWITMLMPIVVIFYYPEENQFECDGKVIFSMYPLVTPNQIYLFRKAKKSIEFINSKYGIRIKILYPKN